MAELDPYAPNEGPGNYLSYSRGIIPDSSWGGLFTDAGNIVAQAARAGSQFFQTRAREEFTQAADEIRDTATGRRDMEAGGISYSGLNPPDRPQTPAELNTYQESLTRLTRAHRSGRLSDSHYWSMMDMEARKIRQRYPGFRPEVDTMIKDVLGVDPSNRLVSSLRQEALQGASNTQREHQRWLTEASQRGTPLAVAYNELSAAGRQPTTQALQQEVALFERERRRQEAVGAELTMRRNRNEVVTNDAARNAEEGLAFQFNNVFRSAANSIGGSEYGAFETALSQVQRDIQNGSVNQEQITNLANMWNSTRSRVLSNAVAYLNSRVDPSDPESRSHREVIGNTQRTREIIDNHMAMFDQVGQAIKDKDFGLLNHFQRTNTLMVQGSLNSIYNRHEVVRRYSALKEALGQQGAAQLLIHPAGDPAAINEITKAIIAESTVNLASRNQQGGPQTTLDRVVSERRPGVAQNEHNSMVAGVIARSTRYLGSDDANEEGITRFANSIFGPGNESLLNRFENKAEVYLQLSSPQVARNMQRIRSTPEGVDAYTSYRQWVVTNFAGLMRETAANAQNIVLNAPNTELRFDPNTFSFSLTGEGGTPGQRDTIRNLNSSIQGLRSLINEEESNPEKQRLTLTRAIWGVANDPRNRGLGIDLNRANQGSTPRNLWEGATNALRRAVGDQPSYGPGSAQGSQPHQMTPILDTIGRFEAGRHGYTTMFDGNMRETSNSNLNNMTLSDVRVEMDRVVNDQARNGVEANRRSSAVGRYQFIRPTFDRIVREMKLDPSTTRFTNQVQDSMALHELRNLGLDEFLSNPTPQARTEFINKVASVWRGIQRADGGDPSEGDGTANRAGAGSLREINKALDDLLRRYGGR